MKGTIQNIGILCASCGCKIADNGDSICGECVKNMLACEAMKRDQEPGVGIDCEQLRVSVPGSES